LPTWPRRMPSMPPPWASTLKSSITPNQKSWKKRKSPRVKPTLRKSTSRSSTCILKRKLLRHPPVSHSLKRESPKTSKCCYPAKRVQHTLVGHRLREKIFRAIPRGLAATHARDSSGLSAAADAAVTGEDGPTAAAVIAGVPDSSAVDQAVHVMIAATPLRRAGLSSSRKC